MIDDDIESYRRRDQGGELEVRELSFGRRILATSCPGLIPGIRAIASQE